MKTEPSYAKGMRRKVLGLYVRVRMLFNVCARFQVIGNAEHIPMHMEMLEMKYKTGCDLVICYVLYY